MTNEEFSEKAREMFRDAENIQGRENDLWYLEALNTFLAFSSFSLKDNSLFPYWSDRIDCNSIIYIAHGVKFYSSLSLGKMFLEEMRSIYIDNNEKVWEFTDGFDINRKCILISVSLKRMEKIFITRQALFNASLGKFVDKFDEYIYNLSNCNSYREYVVLKYRKEDINAYHN